MTKEKPLKNDSGKYRSEEDIAISWLRKNPDILKKHPELLTHVQIAFEAENIASLQEKQIHLLRKTNSQLHKKLNSWTRLADANQKAAFCLHTLSISLLKESLKTLKEQTGVYPGTLATSQICRNVLNRFFPDLRFALSWLDSFSNHEPRTIYLGKTINISDGRVAGLLRRVFRNGAPTCEPLNDAQKIALFGKPVDGLASTVVVPVICSDKKTPVAVLSLSSPDPRHFVPGMGTMFLTQLGTLIGVTVTSSAELEE